MEQNSVSREALAGMLKSFLIESGIAEVKVLTDGLINTTILAVCEDGRGYIVQKINTFVFKAPEEIMENIARVTAHILKKGGQTLHFHVTADGKNYLKDDEGGFWRICDYIESMTYNTCTELDVLEALGAAFGEFQNLLSDFDADSLYETIPDFHNTGKRIDKLMADVEADTEDRVKTAGDEIAFVKEMNAFARKLGNELEAGKIPLRVTHNDTKINNVLFDRETHLPIAVIDLDTVMPGLAAMDYGDAVRFACSNAAEDEKDLSLVYLDMDKFEAFTRGFVSKTAGSLTNREVNSLVTGAITITTELGVRFLDDYLTGDKYFKTAYEGHNLVRAKCQFALAKDMYDKRDQMEKTVIRIAEQR